MIANGSLKFNSVRYLGVLLAAIALMALGALAGVWISASGHPAATSQPAVEATAFPQGPADRNGDQPVAPERVPSGQVY
jgi:hypothetical protein